MVVDTSSIDNKKDKQEKKTISKGSNWSGFAKGVGMAFLQTFIYGWLGVNVLFLMNVNPERIFPADVYKPPYSYGQGIPNFEAPSITSMLLGAVAKKQTKKGMKGGGIACENMNINLNESKFMQNKYIQGMYDVGSPYDMKGVDPKSLSGMVRIWIASAIMFSYTKARGLIQGFLGFAKSTCESSPKADLIWFLLAPFIVVFTLIYFVPMIFGILSTIIGEIYNNDNLPYGLLLYIIGIFVFGISLVIPIGVGIVQSLQYLATFTVLPLLLSMRDWKKIFVGKIPILIIIFGVFVLMAAYANLDSTIANVMTFMFIAGHIYRWWTQKKKTSQVQSPE